MRHSKTLISTITLILSTSEVVSWTTTTTTPSSFLLSSKAEKVHLSSRKDFMNAVISSTIGVSTSILLGEVGFLPHRAFAVEETKPASPGTVVNLPNGVSYTVIKSGSGPSVGIGELIAIRFSASTGDMKLDDIFDTPEPYYTRVGSGGLIKGVEETIPLMHLGDRWKMIIPVCFLTKTNVFSFSLMLY
jgi:FKBP-type peptidyl-prolyl cis-trans isomerase